MKIIFFDWAPTEHKYDIINGSQIRRYYAWVALNKINCELISFRRNNGKINLNSVLESFNMNSIIWVEYGCGGVAHFIILLVSLIPNKKIIINIHDVVKQQKDTYSEHSFWKKLRLDYLESFLFNRASIMILPAPGILNYFMPKKNQKIIIMPPGIGEDELKSYEKKKIVEYKKLKTAIYFGSIRKKGEISKIIELFSMLQGWELILVGQIESAKIEQRKNVKYIGIISHDKLQKFLNYADVILICYPKNEYLDMAMPIKLGYALKSGKPILATNLKGISEYVAWVGLKENVIYLDEWNIDNLKKALNKSISLNINIDRTFERLRPMAWEPRFKKASEIVLDFSKDSDKSIEWI